MCSFAAIANGMPAPFPFMCFAFRSSTRASHVSGSSVSFGMLAAGVGHRAAILPRSPFVGTSASAHAPSFQSRAVGVPHIPAAVASPSPLVRLSPFRLWLPFTVAVGHDEKPLSSVSRANVGSS